MKPLDRLSEYLGAIERRLRLLALTRGAAVTAAAALALTVVAVLVANQFAFSNGSVIGRARVPVSRTGVRAGRGADCAGDPPEPPQCRARGRSASIPQFEERLLTFTERVEQQPQRSLPANCWPPTRWRSPSRPSRSTSPRARWIFSFSSAALVAALVLIWLGMSGPGFLGYGTSLLWGGLPKGEMKPFTPSRWSPATRPSASAPTS